ncbi:MAG: aminotransferase class V-fold PLP-dependent enzyme [Sandaracinaceae bacterium]
MPLDVAWVRAQFPGLSRELAFFENAGGSLPASSVVEAIARYLREDMVQLGATYPRSARATERVYAGLDAARELVGAGEDEVALTSSSTISAHLLASAFAHRVAPDDEIVVTDLDHECNRGAWIRMAERRGARVVTWRVDPERAALTMEGLDAALSERTRLVAFTHCSNVVGTIHDAAALVARVHSAGARAVIDGVAYAPHRYVDVGAIGADAYLVSLYKVFGPHLGLLHVAPGFRAELEGQNHAFLAGSGMGELMPGSVPHELAAGVPGIVAYLEALDRHHGGEGNVAGAFERIAEREATLIEPVLTLLREHPRVRVLGEPSSDARVRVCTVTFTVEGSRPSEVVAALDAEGVATRHGHFYAPAAMPGLGISDITQGVVRISGLHYDDDEDVRRLLVALERALRVA